jgi:hypothetical protein
MPLRTLLARRGGLSPGEVVTLVVPLARRLAALHAAGAAHGAVDIAHVVVASDGRAFLTVGSGDGSERDDVAALVRLATEALGPSRDDSLLGVLRASGTATHLAAALLDVCAPEPLALSADMPVSGAVDAPHSTGQVRTVVLGIAAITLAVAVGVATAGPSPAGRHVTARPAPAAVSRPSPSAAATPPRWRAVVSALERRRASAFATGDPSRLRRVYVAGSSALRADVAKLRAALPRGGVARGLSARVLRVTVSSSSSRRASLVVTDAWTSYDVVVGGRVVGNGRRSRAHPLVVMLRRTGVGWRVSAVRPVRSSAARSIGR